MNMKTISENITYKRKASRLELLVRIFWVFTAGIVLIFYGILVVLSFIVQWFYILILGKRHKIFHTIIKTLVVQKFRLSAYACLLTDERPPIIPKVQKA
jgi:hypothetical protein